MVVTIMTEIPTLSVSTRLMSHEGDLTQWVSAENPLTIQHGAHGLVGLGQAIRLVFRGPSRFRDAAETWRSIAAAATIDDAIKAPGSGLVCFGTFTFSDDSPQESVLIVPQVVIGRQGTTSWRTNISLPDQHLQREHSPSSHPASFAPLEWKPGLLSESD